MLFSLGFWGGFILLGATTFSSKVNDIEPTCLIQRVPLFFTFVVFPELHISISIHFSCPYF